MDDVRGRSSFVRKWYVFKMGSNMDVESKVESHTVCISDLLFHADHIQFRDSVFFLQKMLYFHDFRKMQQKSHGLWQDISFIEYFVDSDFEALFK